MKYTIKCKVCNKMIIIPKCLKYRRKFCSKKCLYIDTKRRMKNNKFWNNDICKSNQFKIGHKSYAKSGEKSPNWKGGKPSGKTWKKWSNYVKKRDNYTCQQCGYIGRKNNTFIVAHHIKNYKYYPKLKFIVTNGLTLCRSCHMKVHKINNNIHS